MTQAVSTNNNSLANARTDVLTIMAISSLTYLLGTAIHEHLGHGASCLGLGGQFKEVGAFYVDCHYQGMSDLNIRLMALAGPLASLVQGFLAFAAFRQSRDASPHLRFFLWLLGSLGLMTATGYLLFSGLTGLGDFGVSRDGTFYQVSPEWLWRVLLILLGAAGYALTVRTMLSTMDTLIGGSGPDRMRRAAGLALTAYLTGGLVSVLIGLLNPQGIFIVLASAAAASLGGTSALAWTMTFLKRDRTTTDPPLILSRQWSWIAAGLIFTLIYGLWLGPSINP